MNEPEPLPAFTFSPDGPTTITHPDGTVSVNPPQPGDEAVVPAPVPDEPVAATQTADEPGSMLPPEAPEASQPPVSIADPEPAEDSVVPGIGTSAAEAEAPADVPGVSEPQTDAAAGDSVVNPDGSITTRLPDGSIQTSVRLPGGAMIVTSTTRPGEDPQPHSAEPQRSRRWRGRSK
jgi:hypothetical protein